MGLSARDLPHVLRVLVLAFTPYERHPLASAAGLLRGLSVQLAYRWPTAQVMADGSRAALLWSIPSGPPGSRIRRLLGVVVGVLVGIALFALGNLLLLLGLSALLLARVVTPRQLFDLWVVLAAVRLALTAWRALSAYLHDRRVCRRFPAPTGHRLRVDYLAAVPPGQGHGGRLLQRFLQYADELDAEVVLDCDARTAPFYRRHGFHPVDAKDTGGHRLLMRQQRTRRRGRTGARRLTAPATAPSPDLELPSGA